MNQNKEDSFTWNKATIQHLSNSFAAINTLVKQLKPEVDVTSQRKTLSLIQGKCKIFRQEVNTLIANKDKSIEMLSCDLRTPITSIEGWAELLQTEKLVANDEDLVQSGFEAIQSSCNRLAKLFDDLLSSDDS